VRIRWIAALLFGLAAIVAMPAQAGAVDLPAGFQDTTVFEHIYEPTTFRFAPDGRIFVAEKPGRILEFDNLQDTTPTVFADIRTKVYDTGDRGILGLALDPQFDAGRPYVYVLYTYDHVLGDPAPPPKWGSPNQTGDPCPEPNGADACLVSGRLVRLAAEGNTAAGGVTSPTEKLLAEGWCQQFSSHSIGDLEFGPEGDLYASGGEGASFESADYGQFGTPNSKRNPCGDPPAGAGGEEKPPSAEGGSLRSQNPKLLSGKVIRINPDTGDGVPGNPLFGSSDENERRIIAEGFRNPFRFAIDPETDEVYVGNVGWGEIEEIDRFAGKPGTLYNSGWPCLEGEAPNPGFSGLGLTVCENLYNHPSLTAPPFFSYRHDSGVTPEDPCPTQYGSAVGGLDFYEGKGASAFPSSYDGALFFSDPIRQCLYVMFRGVDDRPDPSTTIPFLTNGNVSPGIDVQEGPEGSLFYAKLSDDEFHGSQGSIHKISYFSGNQPPVARLKVDHESSAGNLTATFDASESSDADGEALQYAWDPQGDGTYETPSGTATKTLSFNDSQNHTVAVRVSDQQSATSIDRLTVYPHDTPPVPSIAEPADPATFRWSVGQAIHFAGGASDQEDGALPATRLDWSSHLYHCPFSGCHAHPLQAFPAVASGTLIAPAHELPSHIELTLTATDSRGLSASKAIELDPQEVTLRIESLPSGLTLSAGPLTKQTPFDLQTIEGSTITLAAPASAEFEAATHPFLSWSDGGERVHSVNALGSATYLAKYDSGVTQQPEGEGPGGGTPTATPPAGSPSPPAPSPIPRSVIDAHPAKTTRSGVARFVFSADQIGAKFRCKLDGKPFVACASPWSYRHLRPGQHRFQVEASNAAGLSEPSPSVYRWTVLCPRSESLLRGRCVASSSQSRRR